MPPASAAPLSSPRPWGGKRDLRNRAGTRIRRRRWSENGEEWRRLKVTFPANVHSHSTEQVFYFDARGLLRRHDYSVDIIGGSDSAHYVSEHKTFGGIVFPTKRRVYAYGADSRPVLDRIAVSIDFHEITVE